MIQATKILIMVPTMSFIVSGISQASEPIDTVIKKDTVIEKYQAPISTDVRKIKKSKPPLRDLKPVVAPGAEKYNSQFQFCSLVGDKLKVYIKNEGFVDSPPVLVALEVNKNVIKTATSDRISAGQTKSVLVDLPPIKDFRFIIKIDPNNTIEESNERNNIAKGICTR